MEKQLESIRVKIDKFPMKDVFNMDDISLFYRLQTDHSLATKQLEGRKQNKERLTVIICCNEDGSINTFMDYWKICKAILRQVCQHE